MFQRWILINFEANSPECPWLQTQSPWVSRCFHCSRGRPRPRSCWEKVLQSLSPNPLWTPGNREILSISLSTRKGETLLFHFMIYRENKHCVKVVQSCRFHSGVTFNYQLCRIWKPKGNQCSKRDKLESAGLMKLSQGELQGKKGSTFLMNLALSVWFSEPEKAFQGKVGFSQHYGKPECAEFRLYKLAKLMLGKQLS